MLCAADNLLLFAVINRRDCSAPSLILSVSYFYKHQAVLIQHDQVNFTEAAGVIPLNEPELVC